SARGRRRRSATTPYSSNGRRGRTAARETPFRAGPTCPACLAARPALQRARFLRRAAIAPTPLATRRRLAGSGVAALIAAPVTIGSVNTEPLAVPSAFDRARNRL